MGDGGAVKELLKAVEGHVRSGSIQFHRLSLIETEMVTPESKIGPNPGVPGSAPATKPRLHWRCAGQKKSQSTSGLKMVVVKSDINRKKPFSLTRGPAL